jgi:hypothetical protein
VKRVIHTLPLYRWESSSVLPRIGILAGTGLSGVIWEGFGSRRLKGKLETPLGFKRKLLENREFWLAVAQYEN